jgi:hypothetical protein
MEDAGGAEGALKPHLESRKAFISINTLARSIRD